MDGDSIDDGPEYASASSEALAPEVQLVPPEHVGLELDEYLCLLYPQVPKGRLRHEVRCGRVLIDGLRVRPSHRLRENQVLLLFLEEDTLDRALPVAPELELSVLFEDERVLCVDKPAGLSVEPERWIRENGSMSGALLARAKSESSDAEPLAWRPRLVHRLDKETSGVLLAAKDIEAERELRGAFERGQVEKSYLALVEGEHPLGDGEREVIDAALGPDPRKSGKMQVDARGKPSLTEIEVVERFYGYTLLRCFPRTGRTHQIRVHLASAGFPLAVDKVYGRRDALLLSELKRSYKAKPGRPERPLVERSTLHAEQLAFRLPGAPAGASVDGATVGQAEFLESSETSSQFVFDSSRSFVRVSAPLHADFERALKQLRKHRPSHNNRA